MYTVHASGKKSRRRIDGRGLWFERLESRRVLSGVGDLSQDLMNSASGEPSGRPVTNLPPQAVADNYQGCENQVLAVSAAEGVLANDIKVNDRKIGAKLWEPPPQGTLQLAVDGGFTYVPDKNFNREDSFQYVAVSADGISEPATVTITIDTPYPWHNCLQCLDVNDDTYISPIDALLVINRLNAGGGGLLPTDRDRPLTKPFYDVNRDGYLSPIDALRVINFLYIRRAAQEGPTLDVMNPLPASMTATDASIICGAYKTTPLPDNELVARHEAAAPEMEQPANADAAKALDLMYTQLETAPSTCATDAAYSGLCDTVEQRIAVTDAVLAMQGEESDVLLPPGLLALAAM